MRKLRDKDGDLWEEQPDGRYVLTHSVTYPGAEGRDATLGDLVHAYGPLDDVTSEPTPEKLRDADGDIWTRRSSDGKYVLTECPDRFSVGAVATHSTLTELHGPLTEVEPVEQTPEKIWDKDGDLWVRREDGNYVLTECTYDPAVGTVLSYSEIETTFAPFQGTGGNADFAAFLAELGDLVERWTKRLGA